MRKANFTVLTLLVLFTLFLAQAASAAEQSIDVSNRALNSSPLRGPEGIVLALDGNLYVSERGGKISRVTPDGKTEMFVDLNTLSENGEKPISPIGLALDKDGDIYEIFRVHQLI